MKQLPLRGLVGHPQDLNQSKWTTGFASRGAKDRLLVVTEVQEFERGPLGTTANGSWEAN